MNRRKNFTEEEIEGFFETTRYLNPLIKNDKDLDDLLFFMKESAIEKIKSLNAKRVVQYLTVKISTDDDTSQFWYRKKKEPFNVRMISFRGQMLGVEGFGGFEPEDCYIVCDGEFQGNLILKKHCVIIK